MGSFRKSQDLILSNHARSRMCQRGIKSDDVDLIRSFGEQVDEGFLMSDRAVDQMIVYLKSTMQSLERLRGVALIGGGEHVITIYRADRQRIRRLRGMV